MMRLNSKAEKRLFKWDEIKHLTKREMYHLFIESAITGWDTVDQQKQYHAKERARCVGTIDKKSVWGERPNICYECESIFKNLKERADDALES